MRLSEIVETGKKQDLTPFIPFILIRERIRDEKDARDIEKGQPEINWDKVAEVYGIKELIKNIRF